MRKIIIDTDPGQDDAIAIMLAFASPEIEVLGITTVAGNVPLALTQINARKICELSGRNDVPVFAGAEKPMKRALVTAEYVHGKTGMDGPSLPEPSIPLQSQHAVDFIIETIRASDDGDITICALGPLTNIAQAFEQAPDIIPKIKEIIAMGGGLFEGGNTTPVAEFNIYVDPHAAAIVFGCGQPITLMPLDVTHQCLTTAKRVAAFREMGTAVGDAAADLLGFFERFDEQKYGTDGGPLHDPNVIAWMLEPDLYVHRLVNLEVETKSELTMGMTVADWWGVTDRPKNVTYVRGVDSDGFYALLIDRISQL